MKKTPALRTWIIISTLLASGCAKPDEPLPQAEVHPRNAVETAVGPKQSPHEASLPTSLMHDVLWSFTGNPFNNVADFNKSVRQYQRDYGRETSWQGDQVVLVIPRIQVRYMCWKGDDQIEPIVVLNSDNGKDFTAAELLFKLHNAVVKDLRDMDHTFFEGLSLETGKLDPPLYQLHQGS